MIAIAVNKIEKLLLSKWKYVRLVIVISRIDLKWGLVTESGEYRGVSHMDAVIDYQQIDRLVSGRQVQKRSSIFVLPCGGGIPRPFIKERASLLTSEKYNHENFLEQFRESKHVHHSTHGQ